MNLLSTTFLILFLVAALWFIWPLINPVIPMTKEQAGTLETEESRERLNELLSEMNRDAESFPFLLTDANWLRSRANIWAQLNYHDLCDSLNSRSAE